MPGRLSAADRREIHHRVPADRRYTILRRARFLQSVLDLGPAWSARIALHQAYQRREVAMQHDELLQLWLVDQLDGDAIHRRH